MADKITIDQFAQYLKQRDPALASVPDDVLVREALERKPEIINLLQTSEPRPPLGSLYERIGRDIRSNVDLPAQARDLARGISQEISRVKQQGLGPKSEFWREHRLPEVGESLKARYSDPANIIGDLISAHILNAAEGGPELSKMAAKEATARTLQRLTGSGTEPVLIKRLGREEMIARRLAKFEKSKAEIEKTNEQILRDHQAKVDEAHQKYNDAMAEYNAASLEDKVAHAKKVADLRKDWVKKAARSNMAEQEFNRVEGRKSTLTRGQKEYGDRLLQNIKRTYQTVEDRLQSRWNKLRTTQIPGKLSILRDEEGDAKAIAAGMKEAEEKFLHNSPGSVRQFRDLGGLIEKGDKNPTWDQLRTHYSALGDSIYGRKIPPNVQRALTYVRNEVIGPQLQAMAERAGKGDEYQSLLSDHSRFERDWKDMSSITRAGGSPLALARMAPNSATLIPQITGKTGDILIQQLSRYSDAGASPSTASAIRKLNTDISNLPKISVPKFPEKLNIPAGLATGEPPELKLPPDPKLKLLKLPEPVPPIDPVAVRRQRILQYLSRPKTVYDFLPPHVFVEPLVSIPRVREWLANFPRRESPIPASGRAGEVYKRMGPSGGAGPYPPPPSGGPQGGGPSSGPMESEVDMVTRRGPGEPPPVRPVNPLQQQYALVDRLRARYAQLRAAGDPQMFQVGSQLRDAMDAVKKLEAQQWGPQYQSSPRTLGSQGGAGANFTAEELEALKKKWGIQ
ncbi:hypothetical protein J2P12_00165 [Candidatus Bathyarchaeota archaeon]|nr:hypothetical protein [Candidatus Bathyarchaeota archaeon]